MIVTPASAECYITQLNDYICDEYEGRPAKTRPPRILTDVGTDTKVPLPPPTFYYTGKDATSVSDTAGEPMDAIPTCNLPRGKKVIVSTNSELTVALGKSKCGDEVVVKNNTYSGAFNASIKCSDNNPFIIRSENGSAIIKSKFVLNGNSIILSGLKFVGPGSGVVLSGTNNKVLRNYFTDWTNIAVQPINGKGGEIAYNEFTRPHPWGHSSDGSYPLRMGIRTARSDKGYGYFNAYIHHNYFHDFLGKPSSGAYHSGQSDAMEICETGSAMQAGHLIEYNLVENHRGGSGIIDLKCGGLTIQYNTITNSPNGRLDLRNGSNIRMIGNWIANSGGSHILGRDHKVIGNIFTGGAKIDVLAGETSNPADKGGSPNAQNAHLRCNQGPLTVGLTYPNKDKYPALDTEVRSHKGSIKYGKHQGTRVSNGGHCDIKVAKPLSRNDVGLRSKCGEE